MRRILLLALPLLALPTSAFATWSVIAVDRSTRRVVIASATCVNGDDDFSQGHSGGRRSGQGRGRVSGRRRRHAPESDARLSGAAEGHRSKKIIDLLSKDPAFQSRQFGILDLRAGAPGTRG